MKNERAMTEHVETVIRQIEKAPLRPLAQEPKMAAYRITGQPGDLGEFVVKSRSVEGIAWVVEVKSGRRVVCPCIAFRTRNGCKHAAAVREAWDAEPRASLESQLERSVAAERLKRVGVALTRG